MNEQERQRMIREIEEQARATYNARQGHQVARAGKQRYDGPTGLRLVAALLVSLWNGFWELVSMVWAVAVLFGILYLVFTLIRGN